MKESSFSALRPILKKANEIALKVVSEWSDFRIQRTNPCDNAFMQDVDEASTVFDEVSALFPESDPKRIDSIVRSAFLNAMDREKGRRLDERVWKPYGDIEHA